MVDITLLVLVVVAIVVGTRNHNPKHTPYMASLILGFLLAIGLHGLLAKVINSHTQLDYAFSSVVSFAALVIAGAIIFYACLLLYHHYDTERATELYSSFSKVNFVSLPILALAMFCITGLAISELPVNGISTLQTKLASAYSIRAFGSVVQKAGIEPDLINKLGQVPVSQKETSENVIPLAFKSTTINYDQNLEVEMTKKINAERSKNGLKPLEYTNNLADVARNHSIDMLRRRYFAHINLDGKTPFDRLHAAGISYTIAGENLAISSSLDNAVTALMQSPTHKANILNEKFHRTGIGIATNQDGIMAITEEFSN